MTQAIETVSCPVCRGTGGVQVRTSGDIIRCSECELVYLRTRPTVEELEKQYQVYASTPGSHMALPTTIAQLATTPLRRNDIMSDILAFAGDERGRFLDIGSGWGAFLLNAREHKFQVNGIEICKQMADFAWNVLGIYTNATQLEKVEIAAGTVNVVSMLHSLEHLPNTATALNHVHKMLKPGGYFCGIVPNFDSWASNTQKEKWVWLDPVVHYCHFTPETLKKTFWSFGFNILKMYTTAGDYARNLLPSGAQLQKIEKEMHGEEIHWVAQKL